MSPLKKYARIFLNKVRGPVPKFLGVDGFNVAEIMKLRAALDTADYCVENLPMAISFKTNVEMLSFCIEKISPKLLNGLYLEFGVASGTSINQLAEKTSKIVHGFDSFEGLPEDWRDGFDKGAFACAMPKVLPNVVLHRGWFDNTLPNFVERNSEPVAFLHVDCDLYSSTKTIFSCLGPRIVPGTIIAFDEYFNYPSWRQHEYKAFQEFIAESGLSYQYHGYVPSHQQVCVVIM
jgi:hypothetical protein